MTIIKDLNDWIDEKIKTDKDFLRENDVHYELDIVWRNRKCRIFPKIRRCC